MYHKNTSKNDNGNLVSYSQTYFKAIYIKRIWLVSPNKNTENCLLHRAQVYIWPPASRNPIVLFLEVPRKEIHELTKKLIFQVWLPLTAIFYPSNTRSMLTSLPRVQSPQSSPEASTRFLCAEKSESLIKDLGSPPTVHKGCWKQLWSPGLHF